MAQWLSRIEDRCTPVLAWAAAVTAVVTLGPAAFLWHLLSAGDKPRRGGRHSRHADSDMPCHHLAA